MATKTILSTVSHGCTTDTPHGLRVFVSIVMIVIMSYLLPHLTCKEEVDTAIIDTEDLVLVLRFGRDTDKTCLHLDDIVTNYTYCAQSVAVSKVCQVLGEDGTNLPSRRRQCARIHQILRYHSDSLHNFLFQHCSHEM